MKDVLLFMGLNISLFMSVKHRFNIFLKYMILFRFWLIFEDIFHDLGWFFAPGSKRIRIRNTDNYAHIMQCRLDPDPLRIIWIRNSRQLFLSCFARRKWTDAHLVQPEGAGGIHTPSLIVVIDFFRYLFYYCLMDGYLIFARYRDNS